MTTSDLAQHILTNILTYSQRHGDLLHRFNIEYYLQHFDRNNIMLLANRLPPHQPLTLTDFIRIFLLHIPHQQQHTLYLALSLRQLFRNILERTPLASVTIQFSDFTNYLCQKISREDLDVVVPAKRARKGNADEQVTQIDLNPPIIVQKVGDQLPKISKDLPKRNKKLQQKKGVSKIFYSFDKQRIIAMGTLSSSIHLYDRHLKQQIQVRPKQCRETDKEVGILSMAYCSKYHRIGAILTSGSLVFWQGSDNFATQKDISLKQRGDKIFFLSQQDKWITVDSNTIYFWDIREQTVTNSIHIPKTTSIQDICQVQHLKSLCVSVMGQNQQKLLAIYQQGRRKATIDLGNSACHTLHYNKPTQSIIPLGYTNVVPIYTLQGQFDAELKYVLRGHKSIITCVDSLEHNTLMVTGDDTGQIRIWQLSYMRCVQSLKLNKWLGSIKFIGEQLLYSDSRINLLKLEHFVAKPVQKELALYQFYDPTADVLWIFTKKDARRTNIKNGRITGIFVLCREEEEVSAVVQIGDGFVVGTSRGEIWQYNSDCNLKWQRQAHQGEIRQLLYDPTNRLLFSLGTQGKIIAWPERNTPNEQQRKSITFRKKEITLMKVSSQHTILVAGNINDKELTVWNYEVLNLLEVIQLDAVLSAVTVSEIVELMVVATVDMKLHFLKFAKKEHNLGLTLIQQLDLTTIDLGLTDKLEGINEILLFHAHQTTRHECLISTNKGILINLNITQLIKSHFTVTELEKSNESVNILRNQREQFENSYSQRGQKIQISKLMAQIKGEQCQLLWARKICKQSLSSISLLSVRQTAIGALCQQYSKIISSEDGEIQSSLNITQPLPLKWTHKPDSNVQLKQQIYQTLKILDSILRNNGYQMLAKEYKMINVTPFMDMMKLAMYLPPSKNKIPAPVLVDRSNKDQERVEEPTLKALEAFKRVRQIKKQSQESMKVPAMEQQHHETQMDRQTIINILSNDSYHDLINRYHLERDPYLNALSTKLDESLILPSPKPKPTKNTQYLDTKRRFIDRCSLNENTGRQMSVLSKSLRVNKSSTHQLWLDKSETKNIKDILGDLNGKLKRCRQRYNRQLQSEA